MVGAEEVGVVGFGAQALQLADSWSAQRSVYCYVRGVV